METKIITGIYLLHMQELTPFFLGELLVKLGGMLSLNELYHYFLAF